MKRNVLSLAVALFSTVCFWNSIQSAEDAPAFKQALEPIAFSFPADHASHAGYQTEWWYVTGNVQDEKGREFGYQFTIFRRALSPLSAKERGRSSAWAANDFFLLHVAISDIQGKQYVPFEALERGVLGAAGATDAANLTSESALKNSSEPSSRVWMKNASFDRYQSGWRLKASTPRMAIDFELNETKGVILHGKLNEKGLSRKGPKPGQASYYYSVPRLATGGTLTLDGKEFRIVSGLSWMDHEFGSNQLSTEQAGWEWFSIQLDDGSECMLYVLRNKGGSIEPSSSGTWNEKLCCAVHVVFDASMLTPGRGWHSPHSGAEYVLEWTLKLRDIELHIKPMLDDQEFHSEQGAKMNYYEGAIRVEGTHAGKPVKGTGYLEITGKNLGGRM